MSSTPNDTVHVRATRYEVCALPPDHDGYRYFRLIVAHCSGAWTVSDGDRFLTADGTWIEPADPAAFAATEHECDTALRLARDAAPHVVVNGRTADGTWVGMP